MKHAERVEVVPREIVDVPALGLFSQAGIPDYIHQQPSYEFPAIYTTSIKDAVVFGESNFIVTNDGVIAHDLYNFSSDFTSEELHVRCLLNHRTNEIYWGPRADSAETIAVAATFLDACAFNYAHWISEILPRISLFCSLPQFSGVPILVNKELHPNLIASLTLVSNGHPVISLTKNQPLKVTNLISISPSGYIAFGKRPGINNDHVAGIFSAHASQALVRQLESAVGAPTTPLPKKIILRRNAAGRSLTNAALIEEALLAKGFHIAEPEKMSFVEQVQLFSQAEIIVGATGAAMANLIFCKPSCKIIIMISKHKDMPYSYWQHLAASVSCKINYVLGTITGLSDLGFHANFEVNIQDVLNAVEDAA